MPRAENVIDLRDDNVDGELSLEEQLLDKADALGIDEDEAEDIADELEDELEEKGEEMLERLEELDEEAVKSLIASIEDKDEQREVIAYLSQHKNASRFGDMVRNVLKRKPVIDHQTLQRLDAKKDRIRFEKEQKRYRKNFYKAAYKGFAQVYKSNWKANEPLLKKNFSELLNILKAQSDTLSASNPTEAKKLEDFRVNVVVTLYSRANILGRNLGYTLTILKNAISLKHSPNRKLFNDRIVKVSSSAFAFSNDLREYEQYTKSPQKHNENNKPIPLSTDEIKDSLAQDTQSIKSILAILKDILSAKDINNDLNSYLADPLKKIRDEFFERVEAIDPKMKPEISIDIYDTINRFGFMAKEILDLDKELDALLGKYKTLIDTIDAIEEQEEEDESTATPETAKEIPPDSSTETFPVPRTNTGTATNSTEINVLNQVEAFLLSNKDVDWEGDVYSQIKNVKIEFNPKNQHFILTLITALIEAVEGDLIKEDVNLNEVEAEIIKNEGRTLADIVASLEAKPDSDSSASMTDTDTSDDADDTRVYFTLTDDNVGDLRDILNNSKELVEDMGLDIAYVIEHFKEDEKVDILDELKRISNYKTEEEIKTDSAVVKVLGIEDHVLKPGVKIKALPRNPDGSITYPNPVPDLSSWDKIKDIKVTVDKSNVYESHVLDHICRIVVPEIKEAFPDIELTAEELYDRFESGVEKSFENAVEEIKTSKKDSDSSPSESFDDVVLKDEKVVEYLRRRKLTKKYLKKHFNQGSPEILKEKDLIQEEVNRLAEQYEEDSKKLDLDKARVKLFDLKDRRSILSLSPEGVKNQDGSPGYKELPNLYDSSSPEKSRDSIMDKELMIEANKRAPSRRLLVRIIRDIDGDGFLTKKGFSTSIILEGFLEHKGNKVSLRTVLEELEKQRETDEGIKGPNVLEQYVDTLSTEDQGEQAPYLEILGEQLKELRNVPAVETTVKEAIEFSEKQTVLAILDSLEKDDIGTFLSTIVKSKEDTVPVSGVVKRLKLNVNLEETEEDDKVFFEFSPESYKKSGDLVSGKLHIAYLEEDLPVELKNVSNPHILGSIRDFTENSLGVSLGTSRKRLRKDELNALKTAYEGGYLAVNMETSARKTILRLNERNFFNLIEPKKDASFRARKIALAYLYANR